jgi:hypothetical protein
MPFKKKIIGAHKKSPSPSVDSVVLLDFCFAFLGVSQQGEFKNARKRSIHQKK